MTSERKVTERSSDRATERSRDVSNYINIYIYRYIYLYITGDLFSRSQAAKHESPGWVPGGKNVILGCLGSHRLACAYLYPNLVWLGGPQGSLAEGENSDFVNDISKKLVCKQVSNFEDIWGRISLFLVSFWVSEQVHLSVAMAGPDTFCGSPIRVLAPLSSLKRILMVFIRFWGCGCCFWGSQRRVSDVAAPPQWNSLPIDWICSASAYIWCVRICKFLRHRDMASMCCRAVVSTVAGCVCRVYKRKCTC